MLVNILFFSFKYNITHINLFDLFKHQTKYMSFYVQTLLVIANAQFCNNNNKKYTLNKLHSRL